MVPWICLNAHSQFILSRQYFESWSTMKRNPKCKYLVDKQMFLFPVLLMYLLLRQWTSMDCSLFTLKATLGIYRCERNGEFRNWEMKTNTKPMERLKSVWSWYKWKEWLRMEGCRGRRAWEKEAFPVQFWLFPAFETRATSQKPVAAARHWYPAPWYSVQASISSAHGAVARADAGSLNHLKTHSLSHTMVDAGCQLGLLAGMPACLAWALPHNMVTGFRREIQAESSLPFMEVRPSCSFCLLRQS